MQTVIQGASQLQVTPIAYGTWQFGGDRWTSRLPVKAVQPPLSPVPPRHRGRPAAVRRAPHWRAGLRAAGLRAARRHHHRSCQVRPRPLAVAEPSVHRARVRPQSLSRRCAEPLRRGPRRHHRPASGGLGAGPPGRAGRHRRAHPTSSAGKRRSPRSGAEPGRPGRNRQHHGRRGAARRPLSGRHDMTTIQPLRAARRPEEQPCPHRPRCPSALAHDRSGARTMASHPEQGWSLLCNGVVIFDDGGALLPGSRAGPPPPASARTVVPAA